MSASITPVAESRTSVAHDATAGPDLGPGPRSRVQRGRPRARYDRDTVFAILDAALVAHVAFCVDGEARVLPMAYARVGESLILHGSTGNRMMRAIRDAGRASATVTLLDGLVLARSQFHHSVNYRSVAAFGSVREIAEREAKLCALAAVVEHVTPGRSAEARPASEEEAARTMVLELVIEEASAKVRSGGPVDDPEDMDLAVWAGVLPLAPHPGEPQTDDAGRRGLEVPDYVRNWRRPGTNRPGAVS
jgi:nitroimidazol reductase NimA-like FMN-containing flavoprotein (pyridoxamine 5'-phosphate oxidase superfamily)